MSFAHMIIGFFTGETPEEIEAEFQKTRNDFFGEYSSAELRQMEAEDTANYVRNMSAHAMRDVSYNEADTIMYWEEYVIDQKGRRHIIASGETPMIPEKPTQVVFGEIVDDCPVYFELERGV